MADVQDTKTEQPDEAAGQVSRAAVVGCEQAAASTGPGASEADTRAGRWETGDLPINPLGVGHSCRASKGARHEQALQDEVAAVRHHLQARFGSADILTRNPHMHAVLDLMAHAASTVATVLIEGETGTGKELVARALHRASPRREGPLVAVNCAALPETLLANELFGHESGAFTGASGRRTGRLELANGGTLFLDEVGDIPESMQMALLRALQERCFERVGSAKSIAVDMRVVAATNRPLERLVRRGRFRADLFYRLNVVRLELPPLRERPEDIPLLAAHFANKHARPDAPPPRLSPESLILLQAQRWPGNVRELENAIVRACVTVRDGVILPEDLPPGQTGRPVALPSEWIDLERPLPQLLAETAAELERRYLVKALHKSRGNVGRCARLCGLSRRAITIKLAKYKIDRFQFKWS
jgi:DNA-binding NtrC family response regulator